MNLYKRMNVTTSLMLKGLFEYFSQKVRRDIIDFINLTMRVNCEMSDD